MEILIGICFGLLFGLLAGILLSKHKKKVSGSFVIDFSDPMKDVCRLELEEEIYSIYEKKQIVLNVKTISQ